MSIIRALSLIDSSSGLIRRAHTIQYLFCALSGCVFNGRTIKTKVFMRNLYAFSIPV